MKKAKKTAAVVYQCGRDDCPGTESPHPQDACPAIPVPVDHELVCIVELEHGKRTWRCSCGVTGIPVGEIRGVCSADARAESAFGFHRQAPHAGREEPPPGWWQNGVTRG